MVLLAAREHKIEERKARFSSRWIAGVVYLAIQKGFLDVEYTVIPHGLRLNRCKNK